MIYSNKAAAPLVVILCIALAGVLGFAAFKPRKLDGDSRRAAASQESTANLEAATKKQDATAAASVVKIGEANATAPESRERDFIAKEIPVALASLPAPDAQALIDSEKRKAAVLEGRLNAVAELYASAMKRADALERAHAEALADRRKVDLELEQTAAEKLGAEKTRNRYLIGLGILVSIYLYTKFTHLSPGALAEAVKDMKSGTKGLHAIDNVTSRLQQRLSRFFQKHLL